MPTQLFKSRVGMMPPFFLPSADSSPPTATLSGPTGEIDLAVSSAGEHTEFGHRWCAELPGAFWLVGEYEIRWSTGDVYQVLVQKHLGTMRPGEAARFGRLSVEDQRAALALVNPEEG